MPNQCVLVTYASSPSFQTSQTWREIHAALLSQLPLRNIHWKSSSRHSLRTIQELDVVLVPFEQVRDEHASQVPTALLEKPLLNVYIVTCEDHDADLYKATIRRQIKEWTAGVTQRKNQEWLILHVVHPDARMPTGNFFQLKGSVLDKIRADFNVDKRDRCVQLVWSSGQQNPTAWAEFISKLKDGVLSAFDSAVNQREEEIKRLESQRTMPGWNFCTFFAVKESLAASFEGVHLYEDALREYDELEALFYQVPKEKNLSWFGTLLDPAPHDDSTPLLLVSKKPYRDLILANTISVFDFRVYLLARQCALLGQTGRIIELAKKAIAFLGVMGRNLREVETPALAGFVNSWSYSSALSVVEECDIWVTSASEPPSPTTFYAVKGELIELARSQLDIIGIKAGHLPPQLPFSMAFLEKMTNPSPDSEQHSFTGITNSELLSATQDSTAFYDLYINITNRAIDMYAKAGRRKFALKLHGSLAALDVHRGRLATALSVFSSLPAHYAPHMWTSLESFMLSQALDTHSALNKSKDTEWIHILLSFLKTCIENPELQLQMHKEDKEAYISQLVNAMKAAAENLESDLTHPDHPALSIEVAKDARIAGDVDGSFLDVTICNRLPCILPVDGVSVHLSGRDADQVIFSSKTDPLAPGKTSLTLSCSSSSNGTYLLQSSEFRMSRLVFEYNHQRSASSGKTSRSRKGNITLVRIPKDLRALDVHVRMPHRIELGTQPKLLLTIMPGRNIITQAKLKLSGPSGVKFNYAKTILDDCDTTTLQCTEDGIEIRDIPPDKPMDLLIPHSDSSGFIAMKLNVNVEYTTASEPSVTRTLSSSRIVATSLPIAVNVQDFFRGRRLFSRFTISTTTHQHVRLLSARLEGPIEGLDGVQIVKSPVQQRTAITLTPAQPANFLFFLDSRDGPVQDSLTLCIKYRMLRDEVESLITRTVEGFIESSPSFRPQREALVKGLVEALERDASWVELYGITGQLNVQRTDKHEDAQLATAFDALKQTLREHRHSAEAEWREIIIPVDVPQMNIVAAARISILSSPFATEVTSVDELPPLYAGQPLSALLSISTSFHWGSTTKDDSRAYTMRFDVEEMVSEWLVSGRKRGDFIAKDEGSYTVPITLIALHHGELALPKVCVTALPIAGEMTMGSMAIPSTETHQVHGAEKVMVLPRGGRSTFVVDMGGE